MDTLTDFWHSFKRQYMGLLGLVMLVATILVAIFAPVLAPYDPKASVKVTIDNIYSPPSAEPRVYGSRAWKKTSSSSSNQWSIVPQANET
jgi:ABC-type antimicrobial peptide transport system permease subunit